MQTAAMLSLAPRSRRSGATARAHTPATSPFPLTAIRLKPSPFLDAQEANRAYLHRLEPDRLLHGYRAQAGLAPKGLAYGGWEQDSIAGHTLGHYLSACSLMHAQTGDAECLRRVQYVVAELAACQRANGDGFVAAFTRRGEGGSSEPGRRVLEELTRGEIRASRFDLNGCWAPFYNWHKLLAGLLDSHGHCGSEPALRIATALADYIGRALVALDEAQMQSVLETEFGGMSESLAELSARTGEARYLALAQRFHHRAVLEPLMAGRDELEHLHANTQIPKVIGLVRLHELAGGRDRLDGARFFWQAVTAQRSYVIGGNSDRENFQLPNSISRHITEQTCESCNTYNMLKLTRRLYAQDPRTGWFDYYERALFNHVLAQQRPSDGMFAYMIPLLSGSAREYSTPFDSFWCCVGTGMESHARHGDSIYWHGADTLFVNLFIPSEFDWQERQARIVLDTAFPFDERVALRIASLGGDPEFSVAIRAPAWSSRPAVALNGREIDLRRGADGYLVIRRKWREGDRIELRLPMSLRLEATPDDPRTVAVLHGPLVLAADLSAATEPFRGPEPAFVGDNPLDMLVTVDRDRAIYRSRGGLRPEDRVFAPFFVQRDRRVSVYFRRHSPAQWVESLAAEAARREHTRRLDARSVDVIALGEKDDESRHALESAHSFTVVYRRRHGRDVRDGGHFEFQAATADGPLALHATYWGGERDRHFHIEVEGARIATVRLDGDQPWEFIEREYSIPEQLVAGRPKVRVRFEPEPGRRAGPIFGCRVLSLRPGH